MPVCKITLPSGYIPETTTGASRKAKEINHEGAPEGRPPKAPPPFEPLAAIIGLIAMAFAARRNCGSNRLLYYLLLILIFGKSNP